MSSGKKGPGLFRVYRGLYYPVIWGLYLTIIRIAIKQLVFHGKYPWIFFCGSIANDFQELLLMFQKSCTTWDVKNPVNDGINYLYPYIKWCRNSEPSTVSPGG